MLFGQNEAIILVISKYNILFRKPSIFRYKSNFSMHGTKHNITVCSTIVFDDLQVQNVRHNQDKP